MAAYGNARGCPNAWIESIGGCLLFRPTVSEATLPLMASLGHRTARTLASEWVQFHASLWDVSTWMRILPVLLKNDNVMRKATQRLKGMRPRSTSLAIASLKNFHFHPHLANNSSEFIGSISISNKTQLI